MHVCVYVYAYVCMPMCVYVCMCVCVSEMTTPDALLGFPLYFVWDRILSSRSHGPQDSQGSPVSFFSSPSRSTGIADVLPHLVWCSIWRVKLRPHTCTTSDFPTEPPPQTEMNIWKVLPILCSWLRSVFSVLLHFWYDLIYAMIPHDTISGL